MAEDNTSPISCTMNVTRLPQNGIAVSIEADESQRAALASTHELLAVGHFSADLLARPWRGDGVRVSGKINADIVQACVVTLEPLDAHIDEEISALFVPEGSKLARLETEIGEIVLDAEGADLPEPFAGDRLDLGAIAEEFFALAINPYPRKEGATFAPVAKDDEDEGDELPSGPLQDALKSLRKTR